MNAPTLVDHSVRTGVRTSLRLRGLRLARSAEAEGPRVVHLAVSSALAEYLHRVQMLGAVQGTRGGLELNPTLAPVLKALHHVLAGGEVEVRPAAAGAHQRVGRHRAAGAHRLEGGHAVAPALHVEVRHDQAGRRAGGHADQRGRPALPPIADEGSVGGRAVEPA